MSFLSPSEAMTAAVLYGDIFHYPLTRHELWRWAIGKKISKEKLIAYTGSDKKQSLFFVKSNRRHIPKRLLRLQTAAHKWHKAKQVVWWLRLIPTIQLVGVTGGLARNNADPDDDIDICVITTNHTVWITRLLATLLVELVARRRHPQEIQVVDAICLNLFFSTQSMAIGQVQQNLYIAHEVLQLVPLFDRGGVYLRFLEKNSWVSRYLPNAWSERMQQLSGKKVYNQDILWYFFGAPMMLFFWCFEPLVRLMQLWYMRSRKTTEITTPDVIAFHPQDSTRQVQHALSVRAKRYGLPLDKVFVLSLK